MTTYHHTTYHRYMITFEWTRADGPDLLVGDGTAALGLGLPIDVRRGDLELIAEYIRTEQGYDATRVTAYQPRPAREQS